MTIWGLIIAGGAGTRMGGVRKADLRIGNRRMLDRVAERLRGINLLIATGPAPQTFHMPHNAVGIADLDAVHTGPIAAIRAASHWLHNRADASDRLVSVSVDSPSLPHDFVARLLAALDHNPAVYATWGSSFYPPNAAWRVGALAGALSDHPSIHSLKALHAHLGSVAVDWTSSSPADPFLGLNTMADVIAAGRRLRDEAVMHTLLH